MISANGKMYDHASAFQKWGFIDWDKEHTMKLEILYISIVQNRIKE